MITKERKLELDIKINTGSVVVKDNNKLEFTDCDDFTIEELEYVINEAKSFIKYKESTKILSEIIFPKSNILSHDVTDYTGK